jgi:hypothetical protein
MPSQVLRRLALNNLIASGWMPCGAFSFKTMNHINDKRTVNFNLKLNEKASVVNFYTNLVAGTK